MVLEHALLSIRPGESDQFEVALAEARAVIAESPGFASLTSLRGIETPDSYLLLIEWETLDDHVLGFRESDRFVRWRELIGPYFAAPPAVGHFVEVSLPG
jgi:heme-degrading monooxygenase HmoA